MRLDGNLQVSTPPFPATGEEVGLDAWMETWQTARPHTLVVRLEILKAVAASLEVPGPPATLRHLSNPRDIRVSWPGQGGVKVEIGSAPAASDVGDALFAFSLLARELLGGKGCTLPPSQKCAGIPPLLDEIIEDAYDGNYICIADLQDDLNAVHLLLPFSLASLRFPKDISSIEQSPVPEVGVDCRVGRYPVTNGDFKEFALHTGFMPTTPKDLEDPTRQDHPVTGISVEIAELYCQWVGGRLPTEVEWQRICSGPEGRSYPWGMADGTVGEHGNWNQPTTGTTSVKVHSKGAAGPGRPQDLIGNVWEMCLAPPGSATTPIKGGSFRWPQLNSWNKRDIIARESWDVPGVPSKDRSKELDIDLGQVGWRVLWLPPPDDNPPFGEVQALPDPLGQGDAERLADLWLTRSRLAGALATVIAAIARDALKSAFQAFQSGSGSFHDLLVICSQAEREKIFKALKDQGIPCIQTGARKDGFIRPGNSKDRAAIRSDADLAGFGILPVNPGYEGLDKILGLRKTTLQSDQWLIFASHRAYDPILRAWLERSFGRPCLLVLAELGFINAALETFQNKTEGRLDLRRGDGIDPRRDRITDPHQVDALLCRHISDAAQQEASDIHIEPSPDGVVTRYRIDGSLEQRGIHQPSEMAKVFAARVKIMANLDVVQRRLPQDGSIHANSPKDGSLLDLRVSTLPTSEGETIVMRLLPQSQGMKTLGGLGLTEDQLEMLSNSLALSHGLILVSGPTGSGKSTTLYGCLNALMDRPKNLVTIEDPVEYRLPRVSQMEVNLRIGRTFASGLRAVLRQDPDIIMVGEIRDEESGRLAIEAAQTGHLVLSTVHTNDAPGIIDRLVNFGIPRFAIADSLALGVAQRLVRRLCPHCATKTTMCDWGELLRRNENFGMSPAFAKKMAEELGLFDIYGRGAFFVPPQGGCDKCNKGYRGRIALYEMFSVTDQVRQAILDPGSDAAGLRKVAGPDGGPLATMSAAARQLIRDNKTTVEEVLGVLARN
jgi:general secretion pathway protein E